MTSQLQVSLSVHKAPLYFCTAGEDYEGVDVALSFTEDHSSFAVVVRVLGDSVVEGDERLVAAIVVPPGENGVTLKSSRADITIIDDDSTLIWES